MSQLRLHVACKLLRYKSSAIGRAKSYAHGIVQLSYFLSIHASLLGKDAIVIVPTGFGKSLTYQVLPFCTSFLLELLGKSSLKIPWVLVVSPLTALMQDQAKKLSRIAGVVPAVLLTKSVGDNGGWNPSTSKSRGFLE